MTLQDLQKQKFIRFCFQNNGNSEFFNVNFNNNENNFLGLAYRRKNDVAIFK